MAVHPRVPVPTAVPPPPGEASDYRSDKTTIEDVLALPYGGDRNVALRHLLIREVPALRELATGDPGPDFQRSLALVRYAAVQVNGDITVTCLPALADDVSKALGGETERLRGPEGTSTILRLHKSERPLIKAPILNAHPKRGGDETR